jgi:hypothetical protein
MGAFVLETRFKIRKITIVPSFLGMKHCLPSFTENTLMEYEQGNKLGLYFRHKRLDSRMDKLHSADVCAPALLYVNYNQTVSLFFSVGEACTRISPFCLF